MAPTDRRGWSWRRPTRRRCPRRRTWYLTTNLPRPGSPRRRSRPVPRPTWPRSCACTGCATGSSRATSKSSTNWAGPTSRSARIGPSAATGSWSAAPSPSAGGPGSRSRGPRRGSPGAGAKADRRGRGPAGADESTARGAGSGGEKGEPEPADPAPGAGGAAGRGARWPVVTPPSARLAHPWRWLWRCWRAWSDAPAPRLQALLDVGMEVVLSTYISGVNKVTVIRQVTRRLCKLQE